MAGRGKSIVVGLLAVCAVVVAAAGWSLRNLAREQWALHLLRHGDEREQIRAAETLVALGSRRAVPVLVELLREIVHDGAGSSAAPFDHGVPWFETLVDGGVFERRRDGLRRMPRVGTMTLSPSSPVPPSCFGRFGVVEGADLLLAALGALGDAGQRARFDLLADCDPALVALAAYGIDRSVHPLDLRDAGVRKLAVMFRDGDDVHAELAAWVLWRLRSFAAPASELFVEVLRSTLREDDEGWRRRAIAAKLLGGLADRRAAPDFVVPALASATSDEHPSVRCAALDALAEFGERAAPALDALRRCLDDRHPALRSAALRALGAVGTAAEPALPRLRELERVETHAGLASALCEAIEKITGDFD